MKFITFTLLCTILLTRGVHSTEKNSTPIPIAPKPSTVQPSTAQPSTAQPSTARPTTTTTQHPKIKLSEHGICKRCHCDEHEKVLDCSHIGLASFFTKDEFEALLYGDIQFETIRLDHNKLQSIGAFPALPLKRLHLNYNKIAKIERSAFKELSQLEFLDLSYNQLTSKALPPAVFEGKFSASIYEPLENLKELNLSHNQLHTLDDDIFEHFPKLESLSLSSNAFHVIDHRTEIAISSLIHLKSLDLSDMQLSTLPPHLLHSLSKSLENLQLAANLLDRIPEALTFAIQLKKLNLDENIFTKLSGENVFPHLTHLESLSLSFQSKLETIGQGAFSGLENLREIDITNNPLLSTIHTHAFARPIANKTIYDYPPIEKLFLNNNNITILEKALLERWDKINTLDIRRNPWTCNCDNHWLIHTLFPQIAQDTEVLSHDVKCAYPPEWKDVPINDIHNKKKNLRCSDVYGNNPSNDGAILIGILIGVLVGIPLTFGLIILYRRGWFGLLGNRRPGDYNRAFYKVANLGEDF